MDVACSRRPLAVLLSLAVVALGVFFFWPHRDELDLQLDALRRMGYPTSLAEMAARRPPNAAAEAAGAALESALGQVQGESPTRRFPDGFDPHRLLDRPWTDSESAAAFAIRSNDLPALQAVHEALQAPAFQLVTNLTAGPAMKVPQVFGFINTARVLALTAGCEARVGESAAATVRLVDAFELGRLLSEEPTLIVAIGGLVSANLALGGLEDVVSQTRLTDGELSGLQKELGRSWMTNITEWNLVDETCFGLSIADLAATNTAALFGGSGGGPTTVSEWIDQMTFVFYANSGLKRADFAYYVGHMVRNLEAVRGDPRRRSALLLANQSAMVKELAQHRWRRRYSALILPRVFSVWEQDVRVQIHNRAAYAALAVERYRLAHGDALPASLDVLVPEFLDRVPADIFADAPLRYRRLDRGYIIYSIGPDLKDDGGSLLPADDPTDITFRVGR